MFHWKETTRNFQPIARAKIGKIIKRNRPKNSKTMRNRFNSKKTGIKSGKRPV
ncbi:hypothetical protein ADICYQ_1744 [Cyclobacterium qasimii M12-11B]|uniref:Uncharacterized protein n=1 Tax=Cyclobacterium qasimii M12-11B TaxID=641524 RepID=S7WRA7_9BACT|nr:hypothetical protein ADICYQ_1744 [Cyclobacterium qasimii M12-11B]